MVSKPFFQYWQTKLVLASIVSASATVSVSAAVLENTATLELTTRTPTQLSQSQSTQSQSAQSQSAQTAVVVYPILSEGSTGETVSRLQATLKLLGFYQGEVNGTYDQLTQQAVTAFQAATSLTADGITGPATWRKLLPTPNDIAPNDTGAVAASDTDTTSSEAPTDPAPEQPAANPTEPNLPVLRPSAEGPAVSQLQRELQTLGYYDSTIDGKYGKLTEAAVRAFQTDQQLVVDAIVGPSTWGALTRELQR